MAHLGPFFMGLGLGFSYLLSFDGLVIDDSSICTGRCLSHPQETPLVGGNNNVTSISFKRGGWGGIASQGGKE